MSIQKLVLESLMCLDPVLWYPSQTLVNQCCSLVEIFIVVDLSPLLSLLKQLGNCYLAIVFEPLQEIHHRFFNHLTELFHLLVLWHAQDHSMLQYLQALCLAWEQWGASNKLEEHASNRPYIDAAVVLV